MAGRNIKSTGPAYCGTGKPAKSGPVDT
jgi:hypothetical protein